MSFHAVTRFDSTVSAHRPQIIIIAFGTNDVGTSYSYFLYNIEQMVLRAKSLGATVFLNMLGPIYTTGKEKWPLYNNAIIDVANRHGIPAINVTTTLAQSPGKYLMDDGMHYTPAGAAVVAQIVYDHIVQYLDSKGGRR